MRGVVGCNTDVAFAQHAVWHRVHMWFGKDHVVFVFGRVPLTGASSALSHGLNTSTTLTASRFFI
jgi:hypothetical protein